MAHLSKQIDFDLVIEKADSVCKYKTYTLSNRCKQTIGLTKKDYSTFTYKTENDNNTNKFLLVPKYLFENLYEQIESFKTNNDKTEILNTFTDDIYGIWVYMYYTPLYTTYNRHILKYAQTKLDATNIDDFILDYIESSTKYNKNRPKRVKCYGSDNDKNLNQKYNNLFILTDEDKNSLKKLADYLKSKMNTQDCINIDEKNIKQKPSPNKFDYLRIKDSFDEDESESDDEIEDNNDIKQKPSKLFNKTSTEIKTSINNNNSNKKNIKIESTNNTNSYTWTEVEEYEKNALIPDIVLDEIRDVKFDLSHDKILDEIYGENDEDYKDKTINYVVQIPEKSNKIDSDKQFTINSPEIKSLISEFINDNFNFELLKKDDIGCKYYKCDNFVNNLYNRDFNPRTMRAYADMIMKVRLGMMPYKRVSRTRSTESFNAFCSNLFEVKSVDDKQHILDTSIKYDPEFQYNYYKYNELCEYIITDYQRLVFDIDVESKKTFNKNKEDEFTIEYTMNETTINKIYEEFLIIRFIYDECKKVNPKAQLYAFVQYGTGALVGNYGKKNYWTDQDKIEYEEITKKIFKAFNEEDCHYITEFNTKSSKLLSIHFSISGIVYDRKENEYLRQFLMGKIPTNNYINNKHVVDNLEFLDKSIYVFTQRAWRFAYSCKQQKKECELPPSELQKHKTILYNLFAFPEKDDVEINLCDKLDLQIDTYNKINTAIKQNNGRLSEIYNQINSALRDLKFDNKLHTLNKSDDITEFINNRVELPDNFECLIKHPVIIGKLNNLQNKVQGYPNIRRNVLKFVNDCRIMNLDEENIYNLLLTIEYYHTDGTPNRNKSMIKNLVKYGFKHEIYHTMQLSTDVTNERSKKLLRYRYWLKEDLINFLKRLIFKIGTEYVLKEPSSSKKGIELKFYKFADIKELFSFNVNIFTPYYYKENGKRGNKDDYDEISVELSSIFLPTLIRNIDLHEYNEINVCVTQNTLKQSGTYAEGFKSYNKYNVHIGYDSDDNPIYDCMKKDKCVRNLTFKDRPQIINDIFKNLLYSPNITEEEFEIRKNYFEALFAYKIQNPDMAVQISPIICGAEGICKNTYFGILNGFLNGWCEDELSWDIEMSNFNAQQQDNIIRCYNEVKSTPTAASKLKALITDAMESVNEKHEKRKTSRNLSLKVFLTNERQNNLLNSGSNRRFLYYTPPTTTEEGMELSKKIYINGQIDKKIIDDYKKYIFRLDLSKFTINNIPFNPMQKNIASYLDDMVDFREQFNVVKDTTTQFLDKMVETFKIPEFTNKKRFIPTMFIVAIGNACKNGYQSLEKNNFEFAELCDWYKDNVNEKTTWTAKSIATRLKENDSSYVLKGETRIANLRKEIESINDDQLKELLLKYYKTKVSGFLG